MKFKNAVIFESELTKTIVCDCSFKETTAFGINYWLWNGSTKMLIYSVATRIESCSLATQRALAM